jgi:hypothetical protein
MRRVISIFAFLLLSAALPLAAPAQQAPSDSSSESLGDVARQQRVQRGKEAKKAAKVFTNDNLPAPKMGEAVSSSPAPPENPAPSEPDAAKGAAPATPSETGSKPATPSEEKENKVKTRDFWQQKFKAVRQGVAKAKEQQQLSEDELNLLQIEQARELDTMAKQDLDTKVQSKQSEVDTNKAVTEAAQRALEDLEKEFKDSGAPDDWSRTDEPQEQ